MDRNQLAEWRVGDVEVRHLGRRADTDRHIDEVAIVGGVLAREFHPAIHGAVLIAVAKVAVGVVQGENRLHQHPAQQQGRDGEDPGPWRARRAVPALGLMQGQHRPGQAGDDGRQDDGQGHALALVLGRRPPAQTGLVVPQNDPYGRDQEDDAGDVPGDQAGQSRRQMGEA